MKGNIRKTATALVGAMAMAGAISSANAAEYASLQLGMSDVTGLNNGSALIGTLGIPMPHVGPHFSFEGEFTKALGKPEVSYVDWFGDRISTEVDYWTLGGYGVLAIPLNNQFSLRGRIGLLYESLDVQFRDTGWAPGNFTVSDSDLGLSYGFGLTYKTSSTMKFIAEYTQIESDISHLSAGVQFPL